MRILCTLIFAFLLNGCDSPVVGTFGDMFDIRSKVQKVVGSDEVAVNINNGAYLTVSVVNSPLNGKTSEERKAVSDEIAKIAFDDFKKRKYLKKIFVVFALHERKYLVVNFNSTVESFVYLPNELGSRPEMEGGIH